MSIEEDSLIILGTAFHKLGAANRNENRKREKGTEHLEQENEKKETKSVANWRQ